MRYPFTSENIIDVTKAPYFADNTGKTDCTDALCRVFDDLLRRERDGIEKTRDDLLALSNNCEKDVYIGFEAKVRKGFVYVIYPEVVPAARIIYFPNGEYLVSDTVSYRAKDLYNIYKSAPFYTLTRGIHIMGESREGTVIRLADNSAGFEEGNKKPVLAFTMDERACEIERSNISQLNTCEDITIDCGNNPGAIGLRFVANNGGRVENIDFRAKQAHAAMELAVGAEGVFRSLTADGFDFGVCAHATSMCVYDRLSLNVKKAGVAIRKSRTVFRKCTSGKAPFFDFTLSAVISDNLSEIERKLNSAKGGAHCFFGDAENLGEAPEGVELIVQEEPEDIDIPRYDFALDPKKCAIVEDFGAIGDGVTDSTEAIQRAFNSGKPYIFFTGAHYLVNGRVSVPASVKLVDFMFCDFFSGDALKRGDFKSFLVIDEASDEPLCMERMYAFEQFCGHMRFVEHAAPRELRMRDLVTQASAMYVGGAHRSRVYIDNCFCTTGSYSMSTILAREGKTDDYYTEIPFEFHGQRVLAYNFNPERADLEVLNDGGELTAYCLKTEGPGTAVKTVNGGISNIYINSSAIGNADSTFPLFSDDATSRTMVLAGSAFGLGRDPSLEFRRIYEKEGQPDMLRGEGNPYAFDINF